MTREQHDQNFKNLLYDFPKEALEFFLPQALQKWGQVQSIEFVRQEPKKFRLSDSSLELDMPILFSFQNQQVLLWLVEFQEDKNKFSIYKLLIYTAELMEAYADALIIPTVLFTDRKKWRKNVMRKLDVTFNEQVFLHFEYKFFKSFDLNACDYYNTVNPLVKILLPKMKYEPKERLEVIWQAYWGLYQLVSHGLFDKYVDFIDVYAEVNEAERDRLYHELEHREETAMLAQYIKDKGRQEGLQQGSILTAREDIIEALELRFGSIPESIKIKLNEINEQAKLKAIFRKAILIETIDDFIREC